MLNKLIFIDEYKIKELISDDAELIVWGCGPTSEPIVKTIKDLGGRVAYFGDSNIRLRGQYLHGIKVLALEDMKQHIDAVVIIASFGYVPIYNMLSDFGISKIYALRDVFKYSIEKIKADYDELTNYFEESRTDKSNNVLIELYGNIGDTIIRIGIVKRIIQTYGQENVYMLFADARNAELFRLVSDNIIVLEEKDLDDDSLRLSQLRAINELYFTKSFVLCDIRIYAQRRILNHYNCNIREITYEKNLPENEYLVGLDSDVVRHYLGISEDVKLTAWNELVQYLKNVPDDGDINKKPKYVTVNLGASRKLRHYDSYKFKDVCKYLIARGYEIALVGQGTDDERIANCLIDDADIKGYLTNYVSKLSITDSAQIISNSEFFVGTDSGLWNISYSLGLPSVVLYGGGEYGNFKHPDGMLKYVSVDNRECFGCKWYCKQTDEYGRARCIYDISPAQIISAIEELIQEIQKLDV